MGEARTTLAILAGGAGTRMGKPKSLLTIDGLPILQVLLNRLGWVGPTMLVTSPGVEHPPGWDFFHREVCDEVGGQGPLRGIVTALRAGVERAIFLPVDMPNMTGDALRWLAAQPVECGVFFERSGQIESLPVLLTHGALPSAAARLDDGRRSVYGLAAEQGFAVVASPVEWPADLWLNVNAPADLASIAQRVV